jgi:hypothetical protein
MCQVPAGYNQLWTFLLDMNMLLICTKDKKYEPDRKCTKPWVFRWYDKSEIEIDSNLRHLLLLSFSYRSCHLSIFSLSGKNNWTECGIVVTPHWHLKIYHISTRDSEGICTLHQQLETEKYFQKEISNKYK